MADIHERQLLILFDSWSRARNPDDPQWLRNWAHAAQLAGLPCYADGMTIITWDTWLATHDVSTSDMHVEHAMQTV